MWINTIPVILMGKSYNGIPCACKFICERKKYQQQSHKMGAFNSMIQSTRGAFLGKPKNPSQ